eukprot:179521-Pleurochrysis_carterae.AAC.1
MARKPSQTQHVNMPCQVYGATRLFGDKDLDAPKEVPASQEEFVAGLLGEIGHDNPDGITVAIGPYSIKGSFAVPIELVPQLDHFIQGEHPIVHVLANFQGNATYIRYAIGEQGESMTVKQGAQRALWFDIRLRDTNALAWSIATIKAIETSLAEVGIVNPKVRQKLGKHGYKKNEFHVTFSSTSYQGINAISAFPWWQLKHQLDGTVPPIRGNNQTSRHQNLLLSPQCIPMHLLNRRSQAPPAGHLYPESKATEQRGLSKLLQIASGNA